MRSTYRYEVSGIGHFPIDMLRYDCAWPTHEVDSKRIEGKDYDVPRTVSITSRVEPTVERWKSFGWDVKNVRKI